MHALVIGGTGILAPAVLELAGGGAEISVLTREAAHVSVLRARCRRPAALHTVIGDHQNPEALSQALSAATERRGPVWVALLYMPTAPESSRAVVRSYVDGRLVWVLTSEAGRPEAPVPDPPDGEHVLLLGWHEGPDDPRWHSPAEVSAAALAALRSTERVTKLGALRPWSRRPSQD